MGRSHRPEPGSTPGRGDFLFLFINNKSSYWYNLNKFYLFNKYFFIIILLINCIWPLKKSIYTKNRKYK